MGYNTYSRSYKPPSHWVFVTVQTDVGLYKPQVHQPHFPNEQQEALTLSVLHGFKTTDWLWQ